MQKGQRGESGEWRRHGRAGGRQGAWRHGMIEACFSVDSSRHHEDRLFILLTHIFTDEYTMDSL